MRLEDHQEGERTFRRRWWTSRRRQTPKWQKTSKRRCRQISSWRHRCPFWCSLVRFPLEPMVPTIVSTTNTPLWLLHKRIIVVPNFFCWDKSKCSCSTVLKTIQANGEKWDANIVNLLLFHLNKCNFVMGQKIYAVSYGLHFFRVRRCIL
jgi:hypothetical protein